ncbi:MAG: signal recognition particle protein [Ignavibacteriales bacterium]|nr:signal recognition particle protein [Ignavibacteriales bacterium]
MFEILNDKLEKAIKKITGQGRISEQNISDTLREIRRILLDADVNYKVAKDFIDNVKTKAIGREVLNSVTPGQLITKIINDELISLMGSKVHELSVNASGITKIMLVGLQGCGKTTFAAKLANYLNKNNRKVLLVAADIYRPAAIEQLRLLGKQVNIDVFSINGSNNPVSISERALEFAEENNFNMIVIDTAGRLHIDEDLMTEIRNIKKSVNPNEILFVVDSMIGQDAVNSAKAFNDAIEFDGVVLTKLDGDAKGGCALSIKAVVDKPIKFISTGEKLDMIEIFHPDRLASRILGKGDVVTFVEKAQEQFDDREAEHLEKRLLSNQFDFNDFLKQIKMIKKMGSLKSLLGMIPGVGSAVKNMNVEDNQLVKVESIVQSMTKKERNNPKILNGSRRLRIARGSGNTIQDVNRLLKQFTEMQKMMKSFNTKGMNKFKNIKSIKYS